MQELEVVVGLEIHAQIRTRSKMFCRCSNDSFGAQPNTHVCPVCMGFPGMLPVMNRDAFLKGVMAALAFHCEVPAFSKFDRKNYFYPDLPKGFQISQYDRPIAQQGWIDILLDGHKKRIRINRLHLENDAGKLVHVPAGTLCDYNRSGSPLMEIVSEPDLRSVKEASAYPEEVRRILRACGASECDMEKGMMRFDANISLKKTNEKPLGTKVEIKNLNSFRALERALAYEIGRQSEMLSNKKTISQETRGWDDVKGITVSQRSKEEAHDYRYFPEPDLPPLVMTEEEVFAIKASLPELPLERKLRFIESFGMSEEDASLLTEERSRADFFEKTVEVCRDASKTLSFMNTILMRHLHGDGKTLEDCRITPSNMGRLVVLVNEGTISNNMAKSEVFDEMYNTGKDPAVIIKEKGLAVISDKGALEESCSCAIQANPVPAADYKRGKQNALGFLVGKVMQSMKGKANPAIVNEILKKMLG
ncbi:Asp-tRNA(Asn)/Glu-tRNA(Gln) amidotransferase subunit GatB [Candidatus Peregrinibacteria bacterium]|nr:Asp-tRNA(Asn)/Glu-tRNA(Gln) amidotransferase subunit GatB [Candidatus Peregrinibacteria bacterium]